MVSLKVLILTSLAIITGNVCNKPDTCGRINFSTSEKIIYLEKDEYSLTEEKTVYQLTVLSPHKLTDIKALVNPRIEFCYKNKTIQSIGIGLFESGVPHSAENFYVLNSNNNVGFNGNRLLLRKNRTGH
jgi:hypothetical protein